MSNHSSSPVEVVDKTYRGLRNFNLIMGIMHLLQGVLMIVLSNDTRYPIFTDYTFKVDLSTFSLTPDPQLAYKLLFRSRCGSLPAALCRGTLQPGILRLQVVRGTAQEGHKIHPASTSMPCPP